MRADVTPRKAGPDLIDVDVGLALRRTRLARGLSQSELAEGLGITFQQIQKYERGANRMAVSRLVKAARFLQVRASDLLPVEDADPAAIAFLQGFGAVGGMAEMLNAYCAIRSKSQRRAVLSFMQAMARESAKDGADQTEAAQPR